MKVFEQILLASIAAIVIGILASTGLQKAVDVAVKADAESKSITWAEQISSEMPDLVELISTGKFTDEQSRVIGHATSLGDIFRFKLFNAEGQLILISDELNQQLEIDGEGDHNGTAAQVLQTGVNAVSVNDGRSKDDRPDLYAEAYVPVKQRGSIVGVVEVYVDETETSLLFHQTFQLIFLAISVCFALAFGVPFAGYLIKNRQEEMSRSSAEYLAKFDGLTGLYNRSGFMQEAKKLSGNLEASAKNIGVVYCDLDKFKTVNDTYGHHAGDAVLRQAGQVILDNLNDKDIAGRLGGDEFVIVIQRDNIDEVIKVVENIRKNISRPIQFEGGAINGRMSAGIHFAPTADISIDRRLNQADAALYQAKLDGRNTYRVYTRELEEQISRRREIEDAVTNGLANDQFNLDFQPLLNSETGECLGFEALLRLTDDYGSLIPPAEFIPIAEAIGEIEKIGTWVLQQATKVAATWPEGTYVSVNLSARQFDSGKLASFVADALDAAGLKPERLELELTESLLMDNVESVSAQLQELRQLGVSLAMDDFGTGYSSLGYLWQYRFDKLKIDRSFVTGLDNNNAAAQEILETIVMLGHRLDMQVTAEGVETQAQATALSKLSCDQFQGFFFGRPMPASDIAAFMLNNFSASSASERADKKIGVLG